MNKTVSWIVMTLLAFAIGAYALVSAVMPGIRTEVGVNMVQTSAGGAMLHFLGGAIVIIAGAFQFNSSLRARYLTLHRWLGRVYIFGALAGGIAGLYLAFYSTGGLVAHFGFGLLAVCWLGTTFTAYRHIRAGNIRIHQDWMIRSYALTLAAVTLRIYIPVFQIAGISFEAAYPAIAWLCWVPNILLAEWFLVPASNRRQQAQASA